MRNKRYTAQGSWIGSRIPALADVNQMPPEQPTARRFQVASRTCLIVTLVVIGIVSFAAIAVMRARGAAQRASSANNLMQMGHSYLTWAKEHEGFLPPLVSTSSAFRAETGTFAPKNMTDPYFYLGYIINDEAEARAFIDAYKARAAEGGGFDEDLKVEPGRGSGGSDRIVRLHSDPRSGLPGAGVAVVPDANEVPVMFDRIVHIPGGINVLYLDGHVEFIELEGKFPAQQWFLDALAKLER
ncbi:MAG: hypothetical protein IT365_25830 [Candidatus Hydrogenedentes bacterium]|nr:hypothetical protein [Candidatus Hydrogenedentota bacterium]